jgi:N utilization substance protein A
MVKRKMCAARKSKKDQAVVEGNEELITSLNLLEKERDISKEVLLTTLENALVAACKNQFGKAENIKVNINRENGALHVFQIHEVVEEVTDPVTQISKTEADAKLPGGEHEVGTTVDIEVTPKDFGRIAAQKAKQVVVQKVREEERRVLFEQFSAKEKDIVTGIVQRYSGKDVYLNLGKVDAVLTEAGQIPGEHFMLTERIKVYVAQVQDTTKGPRVTVSRTHSDFVKRLFEEEVTEIKDGIVEVKSISREPGARTKMAVYSNDSNVDPVGACVGINGERVNAVVNELRGEKIDIIRWSDDPAILIENALSPSDVVSVEVDTEAKSAKVVVPGYQLSLAIGREGQNARLAARLTGYKIDIKGDGNMNADAYYELPDVPDTEEDAGEGNGDETV